MFVVNSIGNAEAKINSLKHASSKGDVDGEVKPPKFYKSVQFISLLAYFIWLWIGILWYKYYNNWTFSTAYYYALEAGLSIGFCEPAEKDDGSKAFTILYVLVGSSIIAGSLGAFMTSFFYSRLKLAPVEYVSGYLSMKDLNTDEYTFQSVKNYFWFEFKLAIGWYHHRTRVCCLLAFFIWMALGTAYGIHVEKWSVITSIYWAITSSSTGGLQSAECIAGTANETCDIGVLRGGLMGTFFLLGVPIYAFAMSQFSGILIEKALAERDGMLLRAPIEEPEFYYAANILSPEGSQTLNAGEYMLFQLMRLGLTNHEQIERFKADFRRLDKNGIGVIDIDVFRENKLAVPEKPSRSRNAMRRPKSVELILNLFNPRAKGALSPTKEETRRRQSSNAPGSDSASPPNSLYSSTPRQTPRNSLTNDGASEKNFTNKDVGDYILNVNDIDPNTQPLETPRGVNPVTKMDDHGNVYVTPSNLIMSPYTNSFSNIYDPGANSNSESETEDN